MYINFYMMLECVYNGNFYLSNIVREYLIPRKLILNKKPKLLIPN